MPAASLDRVRNIGIISHIDAGKTTVSERILFYCGEIHKMGEVHDGASTMDWMEQEQQRGITITASATSCHWHDLLINLIDTPGHIDFTIEVERSLRALDGAIAIFSAVDGVQPQSESVWRQANRYRVPRICLINKMDRVGADHHRVLGELQEKLAARPILLQLPLGNEENFAGVIDILSAKTIRFSTEDQGRTLLIEEAAPEHAAEIAAAREQIIEAAADFDEAILSAFLEGEAVANHALYAALRKGTLGGKIFPVLLTTALHNKGIQPLLDAVGQFLPSPLDAIPPKAIDPRNGGEMTVTCDPTGPLCALAFKVLADGGRKLTYLRIYSGELQPGDSLLVANRDTPEKLARLFRMHSHKRERITSAGAGDIVAATGLKTVLTGDSLCRIEEPLLLAGLECPEPVVSLAVEPRAVDDREKLPSALEKLQWEDPTFRVKDDPETGQTLLTGMGELHLEVIVERLAKDFGVQVNTGRPQVVYRETVRKPVVEHQIFERELEGKPHHGEVKLHIEPLAKRSGLKIDLPETLAETLPEEIHNCLTPEIELACQSGPIAGYPLTDLSIKIIDLPFEPGKTTARGIETVLQIALSQAVRKGAPTLLQPVMKLELTTPNENTGRVMGGLQQKGGQVAGITSHADIDVIHASIALTEMFGYITELRSATKGRGSFTMEFSHFEQAADETLTRFGL